VSSLWPPYIGENGELWGKEYAIKCAVLWGTHWELEKHNWEHAGTYWEYAENTKKFKNSIHAPHFPSSVPKTIITMYTYIHSY
jgi:hypothetical protein